MRNHLLFLIFILNSIQLFGQNTMSFDSIVGSPEASLNDISWLEGHWRGEAFGGVTEEIWTPVLGGSMMGSFKLVNDNEVTFYELMTLTEEGNTIVLKIKHFDKMLKGWEEKDESHVFKFVKATENKMYFDDLTFEKVDENHITIYVVIEENGKKEEVPFPYQRFNAK